MNLKSLFLKTIWITKRTRMTTKKKRERKTELQLNTKAIEKQVSLAIL